MNVFSTPVTFSLTPKKKDKEKKKDKKKKKNSSCPNLSHDSQHPKEETMEGMGAALIT